MKYLKIQNSGELDIRLVALMGGTTKANDKFKIGQFGTGLKYTLAFLYRNNLDFAIFVGEEKVNTHIETEEIRGEIFEIICINGQRTSITTKMGMEWDSWMIIRELWCNALDEGGEVKEIFEGELTGVPGTTTFYIQLTEGIQSVLNNWAKYFIPEDLEPIFQNSQYTLYPPGPHLCLYKNGVLIYENINLKTVFRYDIKDAQINELRQYQGTMGADMSNAIKSLDAPGIEYFLHNQNTNCYEGSSLDYNWFASWGESWKTFLLGTKLINDNIRERFEDSGYSYREKDYTLVPQNLYNSLTKNIGALDFFHTAAPKYSFYPLEHTEIETKINSCVSTLSSNGYVLNPSISFQYGIFDEKDYVMKLDAGAKKLLIGVGLSKHTPTEILCMLVEHNEMFIQNIESTHAIKSHFVSIFVKHILSGDSPQIADSQEKIKMAFTLTMPNKGSWDGKWSQEANLHAVFSSVTKERAAELLQGKDSNSWSYSWSDGWRAEITAKIPDEAECKSIQSRSHGFCGYDWMIRSIIDRGEILSRKEVESLSPQSEF